MPTDNDGYDTPPPIDNEDTGGSQTYIYIVKPGDHLYKIASLLGVPYESLAAQTSTPSLIYVGQQFTYVLETGTNTPPPADNDGSSTPGTTAKALINPANLQQRNEDDKADPSLTDNDGTDSDGWDTDNNRPYTDNDNWDTENNDWYTDNDGTDSDGWDTDNNRPHTDNDNWDTENNGWYTDGIDTPTPDTPTPDTPTPDTPSSPDS